ncbi:response regulator [Candidatus Gracilibacteria bacterium]|nr:response regulator [Candidatus Gracilibacteria bacterium]
MSKENPCVLVLEDEALLLEAISKKLIKSGMTTISCTTAEQALDYLESISEKPDVIWLDFYLKGGMDGLEFLTKLKANEAWANIKIIIVSNTASDDKVKSMLALGASKYVLKAEHRLDEIVEQLTDIIAETE